MKENVLSLFAKPKSFNMLYTDEIVCNEKKEDYFS